MESQANTNNSSKKELDLKRQERLKKLREETQERKRNEQEEKRLVQKRLSELRRERDQERAKEERDFAKKVSKARKFLVDINREEINKLNQERTDFINKNKESLKSKSEEIRNFRKNNVDSLKTNLYTKKELKDKKIERKRIKKELKDFKKEYKSKIKFIHTGAEISQTNITREDLQEYKNDSEYAIEMLDIHKEFLNGKIIAIDKIDFKVKKGTIHALIGENGSGKSTLMNTIFGIYTLDQGEMKLFGKNLKVKDSKHANDLGIGMVHQHFKLVEKFTVLENIILGQEELIKINKKYKPIFDNDKKVTDVEKYKETKTPIINETLSRKHFHDITKKYNLIIDPDAIVEDLPVDLKQKVEIIKVLWNPKDILIFDEPTASLGNEEIKALLQTMKDLKSQGITIIFTSHKLEEIKSVADEATVLTNGKSVLNMPISTKMDTSKIIEAMVGEKIVLDFKEDKKLQKIEDKEILKVSKLYYRNEEGILKLEDISLGIKKGEIFGVAGVSDNGQVELVESIAGLNEVSGGNIYIQDENITNWKVDRRNKIISHVPADRHKWGVVNQMSIYDNASFKDINTQRFSSLFLENNKQNYSNEYSNIKEINKKLSVIKYDKETTDLIKKKEDLINQIKEVNLKYKAFGDEDKTSINNLKKVKHGFISEAKKLKSEINITSKKIKSNNKNITKSKNKNMVSILSDTIKDLELTLTSLNNEINLKKSEIKDVKENLIKENKRFSKVKIDNKSHKLEEINLLKEKLNNLNSEIKIKKLLVSEYVKYDKETLNLIKQKKELIYQIEEISIKYKKFDDENKTSINNLKKAKQRFISEAKKLKSEINITSKKIKSNNKNLTKYKNIIIKLETQFDKGIKIDEDKKIILDNKITDSKNKISTLSDAIKDLELKINNLDSEMNLKNSEIESIKGNFIKEKERCSKEKIDNKKNKLEEINLLKEKLNNLNSEIKNKKNSLSNNSLEEEKNEIDNIFEKEKIELLNSKEILLENIKDKKFNNKENLDLMLRDELDKDTYDKYNSIFLKNKGQNLIVNKNAQKQFATRIIKNFDVRGMSSTNDQFLVLSGGNQQKFIVGREVERDHKILLAAYPTRGLDIFAIKNLYKELIKDVVQNNSSTLLFSHEIDELVAVCDRIAIISKGKIVEVLENNKSKAEITKKISTYILGGDA